MISADNIKSHSTGWLFYILFLPLLVAGCGGGADVSRLAGRTMGTSWHISYLPDDRSPSAEQLQEGIGQVLAGINASMSTYHRDSEISRFNKSETGEWFPISPDFYQVLEAALLIGEASRGSYDVTVGPLVDRWGFGPGHQAPEIPPGAEIQDLLERVGQGKLQIDPTVPALLKPVQLSLDFSSIAKGYAVDRVAEYLAAQSIANFLVEIGGEIRASGRSGRGDPWRIAIEQPDAGAQDVAQVVILTDVAVATSGDYRNFFEHDGKRYSHSIDPHKGFPIEHDLVSVTVIHASAMLADGWATAFTVLGEVNAMEVAQEQGLAVYFIRREGDHFLSSYSDAFGQYLQASSGGE